MKKVLAAALAIITMLSVISCSGSSPVMMTYGETKITEAMYTYYVSTYKARYIQAYSDITDSAEFWDSEIADGATGEEVLNDLIYDNVAQILIAVEEFRKAGVKLYESDLKAVDEYLNDMIDEYGSGSRKTLNGYLAEFGVNVEILREMLLMEQKAQLYYEHLYGTDGVEVPDNEACEKYYTENYVRFQQIFINNTVAYEKDEDGSYIQDENGKYKTRDFTAEEMAEINERIAAVETGLKNGEDFDKLKKDYSDSKDYDDGYYFSAATSTNYLTSVVSAAFSLEEGEWMRVTDAAENGVFFIKRLSLEEGAWKDEELSDFFSDFSDYMTEDLYAAKLEAKYGEIEKNDEFIESMSVRFAPANYYYY